MMQLPKQFTLHGHTIRVNVEEISMDGIFGKYDSIREEITVYKKIRECDNDVGLSEIQIAHSFFHELIHVFQHHCGRDFDEQEAQTYAGLLLEFFNTGDIRISPNTVHEPIIQQEID